MRMRDNKFYDIPLIMGETYVTIEGNNAILEYVDVKEDLIRLKCVDSPYVFESNRCTFECYWKLKEEPREDLVKEDEDELKVRFEEIPDYGDLITLKKWKQLCECGGFIDYDGFGCLATKDEMSDIEISPSEYRKELPKWVTHIVWFNK